MRTEVPLHQMNYLGSDPQNGAAPTCMRRRDNPLLRIDKQHRQTISRLNRDEKIRFATHLAITLRGIGQQGPGGFEDTVRMNLPQNRQRQLPSRNAAHQALPVFQNRLAGLELVQTVAHLHSVLISPEAEPVPQPLVGRKSLVV